MVADLTAIGITIAVGALIGVGSGIFRKINPVDTALAVGVIASVTLLRVADIDIAVLTTGVGVAAVTTYLAHEGVRRFRS